MSSNEPSWLDEENDRSEVLTQSGKINNSEAPQLIRITREPERMQKAFYIQQKYAEAFEDLVFKQKRAKGKRAPALAEEAIKMLLDKYGENITNL